MRADLLSLSHSFLNWHIFPSPLVQKRNNYFDLTIQSLSLVLGTSSSSSKMPSIMEDPDRMKLVIVGDGAVGKTCIIMAYAENSFPEGYVPTVFDAYSMSIDLQPGGKKIVEIFDTAGQEEYDRLRPLAYPGTSMFMVCFSVERESSFDNVRQKWVPEVRHHVPRAKIVLVGTKIDLREPNSISKRKGEKLSEEIKAECYMECSAITREGLNDVFTQCFHRHFNPEPIVRGGRSCIFL